MPRLKTFNGRRKTPRKRSGCATCRQRKLKCDEAKPECHRCLASGYYCYYDFRLIWSEYAHLRNTTYLVQSLSKGSAPQPSIWINFLNTTIDDVRLHFSNGRREQKKLPSAKVFVHPLNRTETDQDTPANGAAPVSDDYAAVDSLSVTICSWANLTSLDSYLFDVCRMCPNHPPAGPVENIYNKVILPLAWSSPLVRKCVLAAAAAHLKLHGDGWNPTALETRGAALRCFSRCLGREALTLTCYEILSSILMLCFCDTSDNCRPDWTKHLHGANQIVNRPFLRHCLEENTTATTFIAQYFAEQNILTYTALTPHAQENTLLESALTWLRIVGKPDNEIDCSTGCSKELMTIILEICQRIRTQAQSNSSTRLFSDSTWKRSTEKRLQCLVQVIPVQTSDPADQRHSHSALDSNAMFQASEIFRLAASIMLEYLNPPMEPRDVQKYVRQIVDILGEMPIQPAGQRSSVMWPLFIASCHATKDEDRSSILQRFIRLESQKRFGNILPVRRVVEQVWKQNDLQGGNAATQTHLTRENAIQFTWERAMEVTGLSVSLA